MTIMTPHLPDDALLQTYAQREDCFTDCFASPTQTTLPSLIRAFYTTPLFRVERLILRLAGYGSTDADAAVLAAGGTTFAAWTVEARAMDQILLQDAFGRTRSWLMARDGVVYFGSAVVPPEPGAPLGWTFGMLMGFHRIYSRALLRAAVRRL